MISLTCTLQQGCGVAVRTPALRPLSACGSRGLKPPGRGKAASGRACAAPQGGQQGEHKPSAPEPVDGQWAQELLKEIVDSPELGKRGEAWFAAQLVAFLLVAFPPDGLRALLDAAGWLTIAGGLGLAVAAQQGLGKKLTPLPKPRDQSSLVTDGIYGLVCHPMYGGIGLAFVGLSLALGDDLRLVFAILTLVLLDRKASYEEELLVEKWGAQYEEYKRSTKKLIPYIW